MATSGYVDTNSYNGAFLRLEWNRTSYSSATGTNYIHWILKGVKSTSGYYLARNFKVTSYSFVTGSTTELYSSSSDIQLYDGTVIAEGDDYFTTNPDGTCKIQFNIEGAIYTYAVNCTGYDSWDLDTIPMYPTGASISVASKTVNSVTINWSVNENCSQVQYKIDNGNWIDVVGSGTSGSYTITGLSPATSYTIYGDFKRADSGLWCQTKPSVNVTTYTKTIPTISLSSKTVNSLTVISGCNVAVSQTKYRIKKSGGNYGSYQSTGTFTGLIPNTLYVIEVYKVGSASGDVGTATLSVSTYDIAKLTSYPNFNLGDNETITYTNPSEGTIAVGMYKTDGATAIRSYQSASGTSYIFSFTDEELDNLYKMYGNTNQISVRIYIKTTANSTSYIDYKTVTITLTGNQKTGHVKIDGAWKRTKKWIKVNGTWKRCVRWINVGGTWKRCI